MYKKEKIAYESMYREMLDLREEIYKSLGWFLDTLFFLFFSFQINNQWVSLFSDSKLSICLNFIYL